MSWPGSNRRRQPQPVWRWMILFFFITFVASFGLSKAVSPIGDSLVSSFNSGQHTFTGIIVDAHSAHARYSLYDGHRAYILSGPEIPGKYADHRVRIQGTLHHGVLEVKTISGA